ncbi:hypothetical protein BC828DRAFT_30649 [Blastocladiella britannica]|nr:hypothetical protein BC828DRAFT_30649 [Blastocladiella britannica]
MGVTDDAQIWTTLATYICQRELSVDPARIAFEVLSMVQDRKLWAVPLLVKIGAGDPAFTVDLAAVTDAMTEPERMCAVADALAATGNPFAYTVANTLLAKLYTPEWTDDWVALLLYTCLKPKWAPDTARVQEGALLALSNHFAAANEPGCLEPPTLLDAVAAVIVKAFDPDTCTASASVAPAIAQVFAHILCTPLFDLDDRGYGCCRYNVGFINSFNKESNVYGDEAEDDASSSDDHGSDYCSSDGTDNDDDDFSDGGCDCDAVCFCSDIAAVTDEGGAVDFNGDDDGSASDEEADRGYEKLKGQVVAWTARRNKIDDAQAARARATVPHLMALATCEHDEAVTYAVQALGRILSWPARAVADVALGADAHTLLLQKIRSPTLSHDVRCGTLAALAAWATTNHDTTQLDPELTTLMVNWITTETDHPTLHLTYALLKGILRQQSALDLALVSQIATTVLATQDYCDGFSMGMGSIRHEQLWTMAAIAKVAAYNRCFDVLVALADHGLGPWMARSYNNVHTEPESDFDKYEPVLRVLRAYQTSGVDSKPIWGDRGKVEEWYDAFDENLWEYCEFFDPEVCRLLDDVQRGFGREPYGFRHD